MSLEKNNKKNIEIFGDFQIRKHYNKHEEKWYFSVIDVIGVLIDSKEHKRSQSYWTTLKNRLKKEGSQSVTNCDKLKLVASDGKKYLTDVADLQNIFRIIQSIPSKKAEPFKEWLAKVGNERIEEIADPEKSINRARNNWKEAGRSNTWVQRRMAGQEIRNKLTDRWGVSGVSQGKEFGVLTNVIHKEWSDMSTRQHKELKGLNSQNLRDHMSEGELLLTALAEFSARNVSESRNAYGFDENKKAGIEGGKIAKNARKELEQKTGKNVVTDENFLSQSKRKKLK